MQEAQTAQPDVEPEPVEAEVIDVDPGQELVQRAPPPTAEVGTLFGTSDPSEVVEKVTKVATTLKYILRQQRLTTRIGSNDHVRVEGWQTLGSMTGVFPVKEFTEEIPWPDVVPERLRTARDNGLTFGYRAAFKAQTLAGAVVGGADGTCKRTESKWKDRDDYALMSMAQTRAMSKALKAPLGFIVTMAGYESTPAEEMDTVQQNLPTYGPPMQQGDEAQKLSRAMQFLLTDMDLVAEVRAAIGQDSGGYFPRIVYRAIVHVARAARDGIQQQDQEQEPADGNDAEPGYA